MVSTSTQAKSGDTDYIEFHDTFLIAQLLVLGYCYQRMLHISYSSNVTQPSYTYKHRLSFMCVKSVAFSDKPR